MIHCVSCHVARMSMSFFASTTQTWLAAEQNADPTHCRWHFSITKMNHPQRSSYHRHHNVTYKNSCMTWIPHSLSSSPTHSHQALTHTHTNTHTGNMNFIPFAPLRMRKNLCGCQMGIVHNSTLERRTVVTGLDKRTAKQGKGWIRRAKEQTK